MYFHTLMQFCFSKNATQRLARCEKFPKYFTAIRFVLF